MNDLFQSLQMFQNGARELAVGNAFRSAADQASQINLQQQDEFEKRQQMQMLGQQLAAQLSAVGASGQQVQQGAAMYAPQQINGPQDMFQQAAMAKPGSKAQTQWQEAGQQIQQDLASAPLTRQQQEQNKLGWASLMATQDQAVRAGKDKIQEKLMERQVPDFQVMEGIIPLEEDVKKMKNTNASRLAIQSTLRKIESRVQKYGTEKFSLTNADALSLQSLYKDAVSELRTMHELGVLNKEDIPQLEGILPDPTSYGMVFTPASAQKVLGAYQTFKDNLGDKIAARGLARGYIPSASSPLRANAIRIQREQKLDSEYNNLVQTFQSTPPDSPYYPALQQAMQAFDTKYRQEKENRGMTISNEQLR